METLAIEKTFFITHIHWDREWYWPVEKYRFRLIEVFEAMKQTIDRDDYHSFWFDGQMVFVEDYLEARPQDRALIKRWVEEGKLHIGPFYVLNDEQLPTGEAQIRNYIVGMRLAAEFGPVAKVGYMSDNFGHMSQTPQLLKGFGIDNAIFGRGYEINDDTEDLAIWRGADGSEVLAVLLTRHYSSCAGLDLNDEATFEHSLESIEFLKQHCTSGQLLLMYGIDHALPNPDTAKIIAKLTERSGLEHISHASFDQFLDAARQTKPSYRLNGELMFIPGLDGTFSANIWQKALNRLAEKELTLYAEPLAAMAEIMAEREYVHQDFERAWKYLLRAHPHDSLPGCHANRVADDMRTRLLRSHDIAAFITEQSFDAIQGTRLDYADPAKCKVLNIFNPLPYRRSTVIRTELFFPENCDGGKRLYLRDATGRRHQATILKARPLCWPQRSDYMIPNRIAHQRLLVEFGPVELSSLGFTAFEVINEHITGNSDIFMGSITGSGHASNTITNIQTSPNQLENEQLKITIYPDATLDITDKTTGHCFTALHQLEAEQDTGSLYSVIPLVERLTYYAQTGKLCLIKNSSTSATVMVATVIEMPTGLAEQNMAAPAMVNIAIKVYYTLVKGERFLRIRTEINNQAENALIRSSFRTKLEHGENWTHTPFDIIKRPPLGNPLTIMERRDVNRYVASEFTAVSDGNNGLAILNNGLPEYCFYQNGQIDLTLLRGSRFIWSNNLRKFPTVEYNSDNGQCLGENIAEYALMPFANAITDGSNLRAAFEYGAVPRPRLGMTPVNLSGIEISNPLVRITAYKKAEDGNGYILRLLNLATKTCSTDIILPWHPKQISRVRLDETQPQVITPATATLKLQIVAKELVTLRLNF